MSKKILFLIEILCSGLIFWSCCCADQRAEIENGGKATNERLLGAHRNITFEDLVCFSPGRSLDEIYKLTGFRGNFEVTYKSGDKNEISIMSYELVDKKGQASDVLWAVFLNRCFKKFVNWVPSAVEQYPYEGTLAPHYVMLKPGDIDRAMRAVNSPSVEIKEPISEQSEQIAHPSDWGLTLAFLPFGAVLSMRQKLEIQANAPLRMKFNGGLLRLGQSRSSVEEIFGEPKMVSTSGGMDVCWYGSDKQFDLLENIHYSTVIVLYRFDRVEVVYGGEFSPTIKLN